MTPWLDDGDCRLFVGDCLEVLRGLPDGSVDCCVTSPPYWGLRDYGVVGQIGLEPTLAEFLSRLVLVFREVRRVLAPHGTCWVNMGDSYAANRSYQVSDSKHAAHEFRGAGAPPIPDGLKPKDLLMQAARLALALQDDGWWLRSEIVWAKPNPMPESVTDRPTKSHEMVYLLTKQPRYFFDQEAVREPATYFGPNGSADTMEGIANARRGEMRGRAGVKPDEIPGRNVRTVWSIATQPYPEAHFATFPEELPRRCIQAGCPERVCVTCGKPSERIVRSAGKERASWGVDQKARILGKPGEPVMRNIWETVGWSDCGHDDWRPGLVLDPFAGSGTTLHVARKHGRHSIGIELSPVYAGLAARRLAQQSLLTEAS